MSATMGWSWWDKHGHGSPPRNLEAFLELIKPFVVEAWQASVPRYLDGKYTLQKEYRGHDLGLVEYDDPKAIERAHGRAKEMMNEFRITFTFRVGVENLEAARGGGWLVRHGNATGDIDGSNKCVQRVFDKTVRVWDW